jgi:hypothetical protein
MNGLFVRYDYFANLQFYGKWCEIYIITGSCLINIVRFLLKNKNGIPGCSQPMSTPVGQYVILLSVYTMPLELRNENGKYYRLVRIFIIE